MAATSVRPRSERAWTVPVSDTRSMRARSHVHAVQIASLEQRLRHKKAMVGWMNLVISIVTVCAVLATIGCAAGMGAVYVSLRAQEPTLTGFLVMALTVSLMLCCIMTRLIVSNAKKALCREVTEVLNERNRLQGLR